MLSQINEKERQSRYIVNIQIAMLIVNLQTTHRTYLIIEIHIKLAFFFFYNIVKIKTVKKQNEVKLRKLLLFAYCSVFQVLK